MNRPSILTFTRNYLPGYRAGGPVRSLVNMVDRLGRHLSFKIVTSDRDVNDSGPYPDVVINQWIDIGLARIYYVNRDQLTVRRIAALIRESAHDTIYLNSFLDPIFTQRVLVARLLGQFPDTPVVLAPRGELSQGAWKFKRFRKHAFLLASRAIGLHDGIIWQASSALEENEIRSMIPNARTVVAMNLAPSAQDLPPLSPAPHRVPGSPLRVCFLSRISPKKNLDFALTVLQDVKCRVDFTVYGPIGEDAYWNYCQSIALALPNNIAFKYGGPLEPSVIPAVLGQQDLFFLPTHGENYGHVIFEALSVGLPVLINDTTPWQNLESEGIGWAFPISAKELFGQTITNVSTWDVEKFQRVSSRARRFALERSLDPVALESNRTLFTSCMT